MAATQISLDLAGRPSAGAIPERTRAESRDESENGRWFEQLFIRVALQQPEFEIEKLLGGSQRSIFRPFAAVEPGPVRDGAVRLFGS